LIRELKEELERKSPSDQSLIEVLRSRVSGNTGNDEESTYDPSVPADKQIVRYRTKDGEIKQVTKLELQDQLQASEKLMESLNLTWEEKMAKTAAIHIEREKALEELGISIDKDVSYFDCGHKADDRWLGCMRLRNILPWSISMKIL
jgi:kinesin family protein 1